MKNKRIITALTAVMLSTTTVGVVAVSANDDITGHYFEKEMRSLESLQIMNGDGQGNFLPNQPVTRAQFAAFLNRSLKLPAANTITFTDTVNHPLGAEVHNAAAAGYINGVGDGKFFPNRTLTREEIALMVSRVLTSNGLNESPAQTPSFKDAKDIKYMEAIQPIFAYGIMDGYDDNTFRPKEGVTRAQTAAVIYKMYNLLEKEEQEKQQAALEKQKAELKKQKREEQSKEQAGNNVGADKDKIDTSKDNIVIATKLINVYEDGMKRVRTYVNVGTEMKFLELIGNNVEVELAGVVGYVNKADVKIVPEDEVESRTHYKVSAGYLRHYITENGALGSYIFGPAPKFLKEGEKDYSFDGKTFTRGSYFQYFNYLPLLSKTSYSAEDLDDYVRSQKSTSPLIGLGEVFKQAEKETGVNALYLLAHAIHESAWGTSKIAADKFNLYGIKAIDADAYNNAMQFTSFEECILYAANYVKKNYLTPGDGSFYNGSFLGHKGVGVNLFYASDPYWGQKVAGRMYVIDEYLGKDDWNNYKIALSKVPSLNVRSGPSTSDKLIYEHRYAGVGMIVLEEIKRKDGTWYKIKSDHPDYEEGYIYANGERGNLAEIIN
ncbi:MAG TPA: SH3 domain-containing protein [Bacillales bacterium]|nr:SH3 domain-containing protein [Bacillales bacterium]